MRERGLPFGYRLFWRPWHAALWRVSEDEMRLRAAIWLRGRSWTGHRVMLKGRIARAPR